jgi:DNA mismatch repair protein MutL
MTTRKIAILPDAVANRIAAGEVVERPASVVKELLENALDAGARAVAVAIEAGGKTLIRVADDGEGMGREDALLALDRHATSKVRTAEDLVGVATFGFRGEALPSIAAVSRFELETATAGEGVGTRLTAAGGRVAAVADVTRRPGTTVTVRSLFHSTPARRKFLRSARSETRACVDVVRTLALARPDLGLSMLADGREVVDAVPTRSLAERIAQVFGAEFAATLVAVDHGEGGVHVTGMVQRPAQAAVAGRVALLFVNRRPFRDPFLVRAAERGFRGTLPAGLRPSLVLALTVPPADVDVNVHPAKLEVRFRDRFAVEAAVEAAVHAALGAVGSAAPLGQGPLPWEHRAVAMPRLGRAETPAPPGDLFGAAPDSGEQTAALAPAPAETATALRVLAQVHETYILVEGADGLLIVDQHSAHERVLFERAMQVLAEGGGASQQLLFPLTLRLTGPELDAVEAHRGLLARLGYEVEPFGPETILVRAAPAPHPRFDAERCLREMVADLAGGRFGGLANRLERFASTFACRAAIKAGTPLTRPEMEELIARLLAAELPAHDVHGRPTVVQLPRHELERRFGRR